MLQRLQTLYLTLGALLLALFVAVGETWAEAIGDSVPWLGTVGYVLAGVTALVALVAVALYKDRATQRRVIAAAQWLDLALVAVVLVGLYIAFDSSAGTAPVGYYYVAMMPIVAYVLLRMARQRVVADIERVRSMDRIR
ncbi:DUF4293 family protein [Rubrivirga sp.]|uniref:DUF4293 family protein n=1 Tax=Rubrivirga sp. TaxID=1885344 RepID=UPI003C764CC0